MLAFAGCIAGALGVAISALAIGFLASRSREWHPHETLSGFVMRRRVGRKWETRPMTLDEEQDYVASRIW